MKKTRIKTNVKLAKKINIMDYLENTEKKAVEYLNSFTVADFTASNIPITMKNMYIEGSYQMNSHWVRSFRLFCKERGLNFDNEYKTILNILNKE